MGADSDKAMLSLLLQIDQKRQNDRKKLPILSIFRTQTARHGTPSINVLAGPDTPLSMPHLSKLQHFATKEERGTQDRRLRVYKACQQESVRPMECPNT